ncbi:MAG: hypothetical protein ACYS9X_28025, partial [Planctomycetota bacterium]
MTGAGPTRGRAPRLGPISAIVICGFVLASPSARAARPRPQDAKPPHGGLLVHVGCGTGSQTVRLARGGRFVVHGLEKDAAKVEKARRLV